MGGFPCAIPELKEEIVDYIVGRVGVSRETVVDCVRARKCDDVAAMYHMLDHSIKEEERRARRAHEASQGSGVPQVVLSASPGPPLSPTSLSPFFHSSSSAAKGGHHSGRSSGSPSGSGTNSPNAVGPTEIFNSDEFTSSLVALEQQQRQQMEVEKLSTLRRHTMGPGQTPMYLDPLNYPPGLGAAAAGVHGAPCDYCAKTGSETPCTHLLSPFAPFNLLPQTNLTMNLAKVGNQPPERFLVKDPHLLKPAAALLGVSASSYTRRASDGGVGWRGLGEVDSAQLQQHMEQQHQDQQPPSASLTPPSRHQSTGSEDSAEQCLSAAQQTLIEANLESSASSSPNQDSNSASCQQQQRSESPCPYSVQVEQLLRRGGTPDSPRRRRTGLDTVLEPPEISPELAQEVESRMKIQQEAMDQSAAANLLAGGAGYVPSTSPISPSGSSVGSTGSSGGGSLRTRRTGLSGLTTVMEVGKNGSNGSGAAASSHSLHLPAGRYSPVRRLSDGSPAFRAAAAAAAGGYQSGLSCSVDPSPSDVRALHEEVRRLSRETAAAASSYDAGFSSVASSANNFLLRPPSPSDGTSGTLARRSSDSGVSSHSHQSPIRGVSPVAATSVTGHRLRPSVSSHSATSEPMQQLYDDMYNTDPSSPGSCGGTPLPTHHPSTQRAGGSSRRFSYPNSPVHHHLQQSQQSQHQPQTVAKDLSNKQSASLTQHLQSLTIQQKISRSRSSGDESSSSVDRGGGGQTNRFKGSITQGVPSRKATTTPTRRAVAAAQAAKVGGVLTRGHSLKAQTNLASASQVRFRICFMRSCLRKTSIIDIFL